MQRFLGETNQDAFLSKVSRRLRQAYLAPSRRDFLVRVERDRGIPFFSIWFRTRGCRHFHRGGCTMCNYGMGPEVASADMIGYVRDALGLVECDGSFALFVSPSGSMLDEWEVPAEARRGIYCLVRDIPWASLIIETRADSVTEDKIKEYVDTLSGRSLAVELGLESANLWILKHSINKSLSLEEFQWAVQILKRYRVVSMANVLLGAPFLTAQEAVEDTVQTIEWALAHGVDECIIFPTHVKQGTLVEWLWQNDMYSPPSLWSLVEVLRRLGPSVIEHVTTTWYKVFYNDADWIGEKYVRSPTTCPKCRDEVIELLDEYQDTRDYRVVSDLSEFNCACKERWASEMSCRQVASLQERVARAYTAIGSEVLTNDWWSRHGSQVLQDVLEPC